MKTLMNLIQIQKMSHIQSGVHSTQQALTVQLDRFNMISNEEDGDKVP